MTATPWDFDEMQLTHSRVVITRSRPVGEESPGKPYRNPLPGVIIPGQDPQDSLVYAREKALLSNLNLNVERVYGAVMVGGADVAFTDDLTGKELYTTTNGYRNINAVDGVCGYEDTVKVGRLGDCGYLVVEGINARGRRFNGFLHTTRLNMMSDTKFVDSKFGKTGGVERMLKQVVGHYQPQEIRLTLAAGIQKQFYVHVIDDQRWLHEKFGVWLGNGWLTPKYVDNTWDGKTYEGDMYAAIRHQVERAGLLGAYDDQHTLLDGDPRSGHASHRAASLGLVDETRDVYMVIPIVTLTR